MMEKLQKRGERIAKRRLDHAKSEIKSVLAAELPEDMQVAETADGIQVEARRLRQLLPENSTLRDVAFLMRAAR